MAKFLRLMSPSRFGCSLLSLVAQVILWMNHLLDVLLQEVLHDHTLDHLDLFHLLNTLVPKFLDRKDHLHTTNTKQLVGIDRVV